MTGARRRTRRLMLEPLESRQMLDGAGAPWLMAPNLTISFAPDGTDIAGYSNSLYTTLDSIAPTSAWQAAIERAFQTWAQHIGTAVNVVGDGGNPFGAPGFTQGDPQFGDVRIGAVPLHSGVIAISIPHNDVVSGTWAGDILFNSNAALNNLDELFAVALHEAGHVFGLGHSTDPDSVMYRHGISPVLTPTADDVATLQQLYGDTEDVDEYFHELGGESDCEDGDDDIATPRALVNYQQLRDAIRYDVAGEINSATDVDFYQFGPVDQALNDALQDLEVLTVTVWVANPGSFVPSVQIMKPSGEVFESRILSNTGGRIVLQTGDASPEDEFLVKVQAADSSGGLVTGPYRLSARFDATEIRLVEMGQGTLDDSQPAVARVLRVAQTSLMHLAIKVDPIESTSSTTVSVVVSDASGDIVANFDSSPGNTDSAPTFLLNPGDYRVEVTAAAAEGQPLPEINYLLQGLAISIPIGAETVDPSADPTLICEPTTGADATCTVLDPAITTPIIVTPPPLLPPPAPTSPVLTETSLPSPSSGGSLPPAANPWFNWVQPLDVNGDGFVSPSDALAIINYLNSVGASTLDVHASANPFLDVNNDSFLSPVDALYVINALNGAAN